VHNPATAHSEDECHQLHPEKAIACSTWRVLVS
ncbi:hypothetical protein VP01_11526g1, partial [Puccinia sorghi]